MSTTGRSRRAVTRASVLVTALLCVPGCAVAGPGAGEATGTAERFHAVVAEGDGAAACELLAPSVVEELAATSGTPCEEAVLDAGLPEAAGRSGRRSPGGRRRSSSTPTPCSSPCRAATGW